MNFPRPFTTCVLVLAAAASFAACGSDDDDSSDTTAAPTTAAATTTSAAATTTSEASSGTLDPDGEFCITAARAEELGDRVDDIEDIGAAELEETVTAAMEASQETLAVAPDDIADVMARNVAFQQKLVALFEQYDWDAAAALTGPEAADVLAEGEAQEADLDEVRTYLEENCGIRDDSDDPDETTPDGSTPDVSTADGVDIDDGEAGLRQFIRLYAIGAKVDVTDEQEDCFVSELSGKVTDEQLESMLRGEDDQDAQVQVGLAALACEIIVAPS